jgi:hypothetical protein
VTPVDTAYSDAPARGARSTSKDDDLLIEIRDRYKTYDSAWQDIRKERNLDVKYISGDPWDPRDRKAREDAMRPCINHDELSQYVQQAVNTMRQNKRGILVNPRGETSNEQTATLRQDLIRTIEYDSDAPSIYAKAYQDMVEGSYAFFRVTRRYVTDQYGELDGDDPRAAMQRQAGNKALFDQHIVVRPIANPNSVLFYPYCKEPDWSDAEDCFVLERIPRARFRDRWPKAQIVDFSRDMRSAASDWIFEDDLLVAEYWRLEYKKRTVYLLENGEVLDRPKGNYIDEREIREKSVKEYITNGVEILEKKEELGTILPIIPMIGLERYLDDTGVSKRVLFSLVRLARDPQMSLAYLNSQQTEEAGLTPKTPFLGYKGQFDSNRVMWTNVTKIPYGFLEADIPDNWPAGQVPPLPTRVPFTPNFGAYEVAKDSCRRAIQAAMGIMPLPTAAQRQSEKSGVALQRIQDEEALGSYHFVDGYDRALRLAGRVIDQWIPAVYSREGRQVHLRTAKEEYRQATLNTVQPYQDKSGKPVHYPVEEVDHSISISTGPSQQSQRDAVNEFLDNLIGQLPKLPIAPPQAAQLLGIAIKMKNLGPLGDEMAEIISPTGDNQSMQQLQQAQGQLQQQGIMIQQLQAELQKLTVEKQAKVVEGEYKMMTERLRAQSALVVEKLKVDAQMAAAEISTKSQILSERMAAVDELYKMAHEQLDDASARASDQAHERALSQQEHQQDMAQGQQAHQQTLQQQDQASQAALAQQQQAAALQPPQEPQEGA